MSNSKSEVRCLVDLAHKRQLSILKALAGSDNPQVINLFNKTSGQCDALEAVLDALNGNSVQLNILTK